MIVLDASLIIAHVLGESTIALDSSIFDILKDDTVIAPAHWSAEVASALISNVRRRRLSQLDVGVILEQIDAYDVALAKPATVRELSDLVAFAAEHQLSAYDAAYIVLALTQGAKLATLDNAMRRAAARLHMEVLPA